jgi:hypothetical protein|tara:strand:+ start:1639 stop:1890 length:252 start_codon:yes stop_codon:yes gene_type:complete
MINFSENYHEYSSKEDLRDLVDEIIEKIGEYHEGSVEGGFSPVMIQDIISELLYEENNKSITIKVSKASDNYHLHLEILNKEK